MALKILNEESEIRVKTDNVKDKVHTARYEMKEEISVLTKKLQKVYDAEQQFKENIKHIGVARGIYDESGNALVGENKPAPQVAKGPAPVKTLAFGKIHTKAAGAK